MSVPSVSAAVPDSALPEEPARAAAGRAGEGEGAAGRAGEGEAPRCLRCGAVGTHYLTCPSLRLPPGYRFAAEPGPAAGPGLPAGPGGPCSGPDHPDWPLPPRR
jgi:hypothetical protein